MKGRPGEIAMFHGAGGIISPPLNLAVVGWFFWHIGFAGKCRYKSLIFPGGQEIVNMVF
jgi:hypothetical protein